jgi:RNA polymerase sigma-70 factor (ECF subfamily)
MTAIDAKHKNTIREAVEHLISRAENARGLSGADIGGRIESVVEKYLLRDQPNASAGEVESFVRDIRADDLCLIVACERGDGAAWDDLVTNFDSTVKSAARKIAPNAEDAEDLAGSIWAELYGLRTDASGNKKSKLAYYSGRGSLGGWLRAVVSQLAIDEFRKQSKFVQIEEDREFDNLASGADGSNGLHVTAAAADNPEEMLTAARSVSDVSSALSTAINALEDEDRLILKLYYFESLKLKDIAAMFGYHEATASRKLTRLQSEIRKGVEKTLQNKHGWTESEVKRHLSETAASLGLSMESMFAALLCLVFVQDIILARVL